MNGREGREEGRSEALLTRTFKMHCAMYMYMYSASSCAPGCCAKFLHTCTLTFWSYMYVNLLVLLFV